MMKVNSDVLAVFLHRCIPNLIYHAVFYGKNNEVDMFL